MEKLTETEKAYLAGFIDGEGCISITKYKSKIINRSISYVLKLHIYQSGISGYEMLKTWKNKVGLGFISGNKYPEHPAYKDSHEWQITANDAILLLNEVIPYLVIKQSQAQLAIKFQKMMKGSKRGMSYGGRTKNGSLSQGILDQREKIYLEMRGLKNN